MKHTSTSKHRHFLVAPVVALLLLATSMPAAPSLAGSTISVTNDVTWHMHEQAQLAWHSKGNTALYIEGDIARLATSSLIATPTAARVQAGKYMLTTINGAFFANYSGNDVTVAALTAPVLVHDGDEVMVVPVGRQWRSRQALRPLVDGSDVWSASRKTQSIPTEFYAKQLALLREMPTVALPAPSLNPKSWLSALQLPEAKKRSQAAVAERTHALALQGRNSAMLTMLTGDELLPKLQIVALNPELVEHVVDSEEAWLLLSQHDAYYVTAWQQRTDASQAALLQATILLPELLLQPMEPDPVVVRTWQEVIADEVAVLPTDVADTIIQRLGPLAVTLEKQGYPERSQTVTDTLFTIGWPIANELTDRTHLTLAELQTIGTMEALPLEPVEDEVPEVVAIAPSEIIERASAWLRDSKALITTQTEIVASGPQTASISNVMFSDGTQDRLLSFELNVETLSVASIVEDEKTYPNELSNEQFIRWASGLL